jgi:hypothetical protein
MHACALLAVYEFTAHTCASSQDKHIDQNEQHQLYKGQTAATLLHAGMQMDNLTTFLHRTLQAAPHSTEPHSTDGQTTLN